MKWFWKVLMFESFWYIIVLFFFSPSLVAVMAILVDCGPLHGCDWWESIGTLEQVDPSSWPHVTRNSGLRLVELSWPLGASLRFDACLYSTPNDTLPAPVCVYGLFWSLLKLPLPSSLLILMFLFEVLAIETLCNLMDKLKWETIRIGVHRDCVIVK